MINEAIIQKIKRRIKAKKEHYNLNKKEILFKRNLVNNIKRTKENVFNMLNPRNFDESKIFYASDLAYIKRCEWWYLNKQDIRYIIKTNPLKPIKLDTEQIKRALKMIRWGKQQYIIAKMYWVSPTYFKYYLKNQWKLVEYVE